MAGRAAAPPLPRDVLRGARLLVGPETVLRWQPEPDRRPACETLPSMRVGRPRTIQSIRRLVRRLAGENSTRGAFWNEHGTPKIGDRSSREIVRFFGGQELLDPGVVPCSRWRPGPNDPDIDVNQYCGVGRKS